MIGTSMAATVPPAPEQPTSIRRLNQLAIEIIVEGKMGVEVEEEAGGGWDGVVRAVPNNMHLVKPSPKADLIYN